MNTTSVTMIDDLDPPDVRMIQNKFIRSTHTPLHDSGMVDSYKPQIRLHHTPPHPSQPPQPPHPPPQPPQPPPQPPQPPPPQSFFPVEEYKTYSNPVNYQYLEPPHYAHNELTCIEISNHVKNCPICKSFYKIDNTLYIIIIVFLGICCIILLKCLVDKSK